MRNDGRCAALAERHFGIGADGAHSVMAMLTLGTGIGGALIHSPSPGCEGVLFDGTSFDAGDFGHHVMRSGADAFQCVCGNRGCFECHASAAGLVRHWRALGGAESAISLDDARSVVTRMREGDALARAAFDAYRVDLASGLANLVTFYNPSLIVLGGGLSSTPELYEGLEAAVDGATLPATRGKCRVARSALGGDCAATGAAWLVFAETAAAPAPPPPAPSAASEKGAVACARHGAIVCLGLTCMDTLMRVPAHPVPDTKCVAQQCRTCGGGNAANSAVAASRLLAEADPPVRLLTKVGSDPHGTALVAELARERIDTRWVVRAAEGHSTPSSVILVSGAERTIVHDPGLTQTAPLVASELHGEPPAEAPAEGSGGGVSRAGSSPGWLDGAALLHLDGRHPDAAVEAAKLARAAGVPVLLDVERPRPGLRELLPLATFVVSSADFPHKLAADDSAAAAAAGRHALGALEDAAPASLARFLLAHCPAASWVCVTLGSKGVVAVERGGAVVAQAAWPLPAEGDGAVRDTTGAGDAFIGGVAACLRRRVPLRATLQVATYVAAANCTADGARGGMPHHMNLPPNLQAFLSDE